MKKFYLFSKSNQQGVTLLLSILVLSSILAISFSISTILFIEVRTSGDLLRTETAFYASQAVTEEALFNIKKGIPTCPTNSPYCITNGGFSSQIGAVLASTTTSSLRPAIFRDKVAPTSNSATTTLNRYPLFNPADPSGGSGYEKIKVTYLNSGNTDYLKLYICQYQVNYSGQACSDITSTEYWLQKDVTLTYLTPEANTEWILDPNQQQELVLFNGLGGSATDYIYVQIEAFGLASSGYPAKGLPLLGQTAVDISAKNSGVNRKIRVTVPNAGSASSGGAVAGATWVGTDSSTQGNWKGVYGAAGYNIINDSSAPNPSYPAFVTVTPSGNNNFTWSSTSSNVRALQRVNAGSNRMIAAWYSGGSFNVNMNFTDSATHRVALYFFDTDSNRNQTIEVLDESNNVLDGPRAWSYSSNNAYYYIWDITGNVTFRFTNGGGSLNAILNGIFINN